MEELKQMEGKTVQQVIDTGNQIMFRCTDESYYYVTVHKDKHPLSQAFEALEGGGA